MINRRHWLFVSILLVLLVGIFAACSTSSTVSKYTSVQTENGTVYTYTLTVDEKNETFSIECDEKPEYRYSGSFSYVNGYLVLQSQENGTQYVRILNDEFSFFSPLPDTPTCDHDYVFVEEKPGTCIARGYKKYACSKCGAEKTEQTVLGEHNYVQKSSTAGTCQKRATALYECSYCGKTREVEGQFGDHSWVRDTAEDRGCLAKKVVTRHCAVSGCNEQEVVKVTDEYGSHSYDDKGVCRYCLFDKNGLCHSHFDEDEDGECDQCKMSVTALQAIRQNGYYTDGEKLYFGAYPTDEASYSADVILAEGMYDETTGYYRYNHASYLVKTRYNLNLKKYETKAFLVTYLTWTKVASTSSTTTFKCDSIVRFKEFVNATVLQNGYHVDDPTKAANDWTTSDLYSFANGEFLSNAFSDGQIALFSGTAVVTIPPASLSEAHTVAAYTDYAKFDLFTSPTDIYFTSTPGATPTSIQCLRGTAGYDGKEGNVTSVYGFVPFVTLNVVIE